MTSSLVDTAFGAAFVGYLLSRYVISLVVRRLRDEHPELWKELGKPSVWQQVLAGFVSWRLTWFIWSSDGLNTGDDAMVLMVWVIRVLTVVVVSSVAAIILIVFHH